MPRPSSGKRPATRARALAWAISTSPWYAEIPDSITATSEDMFRLSAAIRERRLCKLTQFYAGHGRASARKRSTVKRAPWSVRYNAMGYPPCCIWTAARDHRRSATGAGCPITIWMLSRMPVPRARPASFKMPFPDSDRKLLAIEYHEFAECVLKGVTPEVSGPVGPPRTGRLLCGARVGRYPSPRLPSMRSRPRRRACTSRHQRILKI